MAINFVASSSQRVVLPSGATLQNRTAASISVWVKLNSPIGTLPRYVFHWSNGLDAGARRVSLSMGEPNVAVPLTDWALLARRLDGDAIEVISSPATLSVVQHLVAVMDWGGQSLRLYVDGQPVASTAPAGWTGATSNTASVLAQFAAWNNLITNLWFFDGLMEDLRVYTKALTDQEVANLYTARGSDYNTFAMLDRWRMRGWIGGNLATGVGGVADFALGRLHGTPVNAPPTSPNITYQRPQHKVGFPNPTPIQ